MKIIVLSDSHGNTQALIDAIFVEAPDMILHLGDYERDCDKVRSSFPCIPLRAVKGNGDFRGKEPEQDEFVVENKRLFMTHGHLYGVKMGLESLLRETKRRGADIVLFGHTHIPYLETRDELVVINPGSVGLGSKTYAVLKIEHGVVNNKILRLECNG